MQNILFLQGFNKYKTFKKDKKGVLGNDVYYIGYITEKQSGMLMITTT